MSADDRAFADPAPFSGYQLRRVRQLVCEALNAEGLRVVAHPDRVETADGRVVGLHNLVARCRNAPSTRWRQIVYAQVQTMLAACRPEQLDALDLAGAPGRVFPRLVDRRAVPPGMRDAYTYVRPVCGDLVELLVLESNLAVMWLRDCDVGRIGLDALRPVALENLLGVRNQRLRTIALRHDARVHVLEGGGHTASRVLVLPEVLRRDLGCDDVPGGVFVAIPTKYELWLHPIRDRRAYAAYSGLCEEALRAYADDPGSLSPYVYWWRAGKLVQIMTERDGLPYADDEFVRSIVRIADPR